MLVYPQLSDLGTVGDVIVPSPEGVFFASCYLGMSVDGERHQIKVIAHYGKEGPVFEPGEEFEKVKDWEDEGFVIIGAKFKINNGKDGFEAFE